MTVKPEQNQQSHNQESHNQENQPQEGSLPTDRTIYIGVNGSEKESATENSNTINPEEHLHKSSSINTLFSYANQIIPQELRDTLTKERYIKHIQSQFAQTVTPGILRHVNAVIFVRDELYRDENVKAYKLTVYVDGAPTRAELNNRVELITMKYRELFNLYVSVFDIKLSRGKYLKLYPYREELSYLDTTGACAITRKNYPGGITDITTTNPERARIIYETLVNEAIRDEYQNSDDPPLQNGTIITPDIDAFVAPLKSSSLQESFKRLLLAKQQG